MKNPESAEAFRALHTRGDPLMLYNVWDVGSARAVAEAGAPALATGSDSVAAAQGFPDGEAIPFSEVVRLAGRIAATTSLPVSVDFEGGYGAEPAALAKNVTALIEAGVAGINFEDRRIPGAGLYEADVQATRIAALRDAARQADVPLFINARCDLFLQAPPGANLDALTAQAVERAKIYAAAGADGFFAPLLIDETLIGVLCEDAPLPVNIMMMDGAPSMAALKAAGVARVSYGPFPYRKAMETLTRRAQDIFAGGRGD